jgi:hypothetical protein
VLFHRRLACDWRMGLLKSRPSAGGGVWPRAAKHNASNRGIKPGIRNGHRTVRRLIHLHETTTALGKFPIWRFRKLTRPSPIRCATFGYAIRERRCKN